MNRKTQLKRTGFKKRPFPASVPRPSGGVGHSTEKPGTGLQRRSGLKRAPSRAKVTRDGDTAKDIRLECDQLVRDILRLRDHCCMTLTCMETEGLQVSHFIKRGVLALRWDLANCNLQCPSCNERHNTNRKPYRSVMAKFYGAIKVLELDCIGQTNPRVEYVELLTIRDGLRAELARWKR